MFDQWGVPVESYDTKDIVSIVAISIGGVIAVMVLMSVIIVYAFSNLKIKKLPVPSKKHNKALKKGLKHEPWARAHGFEFVGFYMIGVNSQNYMCVWRDEVGERFMAAYVMPTKNTVDLVTLFDQDRGLTTASTKDGLFFPYPSGTYVEGFTKMSMDQRWQQHLESERFLEREVGVVRCPMQREFEQTFLRAIRKQMLYVRTLRLWYLKTVYWYLIRRGKLANKSIEQQHREGLIELDDPVYDVDVM